MFYRSNKRPKFERFFKTLQYIILQTDCMFIKHYSQILLLNEMMVIFLCELVHELPLNSLKEECMQGKTCNWQSIQ